MRILITNDDSISSSVLPRFVKWAMGLGEVTVVVPKHEQSGKSQAIDFRNAVEVKRVDLVEGCEAYTVDSTPADCVRFAVTGLKREYDVVFSGINCGYNLLIQTTFYLLIPVVRTAFETSSNRIAGHKHISVEQNFHSRPQIRWSE